MVPATTGVVHMHEEREEEGGFNRWSSFLQSPPCSEHVKQMIPTFPSLFPRFFSSYIFFSSSSVFASAPWSSVQKYIPILFLEHLNFENQLRMEIGCDEREIGRKLDGESPRKPDLNSF